MSVAGKRVLIIGGGFSGITTAISLIQLCKEKHLQHPYIEIIETSKNAEEKNGYDYSMSIRADSGCEVLKLLPDSIYEKAKDLAIESTDLEILEHDGTNFKKIVEFSQPDPSQAGIRISRVSLWNILRQILPNEVKFSFGVTAINVKENGEETIVTTDEKETPTRIADIVIFCDGRRGKMRELIFPEEKLHFAKVCIIGGYTEMEKIPAQFYQRHCLVCSNGVALFVAHDKENGLLWSVSWKSDYPCIEVLRAETEEQRLGLQNLALEKGKEFPIFFSSLVKNAKMSTLRAMNMYDKKPHSGKGNLVFIGDSCHPVTPFSGNGANMALVDGRKLAEFLTDREITTITEAIKEFTNEMIPRCTQVVEEGRQTIEFAHTNSYVGKIARNTFLRRRAFAMQHPVADKVGQGIIVAGAILGLAFVLSKFNRETDVKGLNTTK